MLVTVPALAWCLLFLLLAHSGQWRKAFVSASVAWGSALTLMVESLSVFRGLARGPLVIGWCLIDLLLLAALWRRGTPSPRLDRPQLPPFCGFLCVVVALLVVTLGVIGLLAPPNEWDSMTYHLPRVMHWSQNKSVGFYATPIQSQLFQGPWSEFAVANLVILSGVDRLAFLVQWFGMAGSVIGVTLIAKQFGANGRAQVLAAVLCATIPMGILEATNTKNDYTLAFWLICFLSCILRFRETPRWSAALGVGASLGLAILTKATGYLYAAPFLIWFVISALRLLRWQAWGRLLTAAALVIGLNLGYWARNLGLYGSPIGPGTESPEHRYANDLFTPRVLISNAIKSTALHLSTPSTRINEALETSIRRIHTLLGIDASDPRTTWGGTVFRIKKLVFKADFTGNPFHLLLILIALGAALAWKRLRLPRGCIQCAIPIVIAFLLSCLYLQWAPWQSRLQLPLFVLWSPVLAVIVTALPVRRLASAVSAVLILASLPWIIFNETRPLVGDRSVFRTPRTLQYFDSRPELELPYLQAAERVNDEGCTQIGLSLRGGNVWEYPFWVLLRGNGRRNVHIEHVDVSNISNRKVSAPDTGQIQPCAIICVSCEEDRLLGHARRFLSVSRYGPVYVFVMRDGGGSKWLGTVVKAQRGQAQAYVDIADEQMKLGAWDTAAAYYRLATANNPGWGLAYTKLGNAYRAMGRSTDAEAAYRRSMLVEPSYVGAYINLADILLARGQGEAALLLYRNAVAVAPELAWPHSALGTAYVRMGNAEEAMAHLQYAVELEPENVAWLLALADGHRALGQTEEAADVYRGVLTLQPGNRAASDALRALQP